MRPAHKKYMQLALDLAKKGWPQVSPNPLVGCVIVKDGEVIATGYHKKFGEPHAEVNAIKKIKKSIHPKDCTLYVNLEPCSHHGKTPPCADLIISKGFKNVVIANKDPNPLVSGKGIEKLKNAGVKVTIGVLEMEGWELNRRFFTFHAEHRPYYILKWAQTNDGFISRLPVPKNRAENMIGDKAQQKEVHQMRAEEMAVMVGKNTVLCDDPNLTTRLHADRHGLVKGKNPVRIFIDKDLEVPQTFNIYNKESATIVFNSIKSEEKKNISFIKINFSANVLKQISENLYRLKIQSVLVEGGAFLLNEFIREVLFDEARIFINKNLKFGTGVKAPKIKSRLRAPQ